MTKEQKLEILRLRDAGRSLLYISACVDGVSYSEIADLCGPEPHPPERLSAAVRAWWMQQPWVWRPDNLRPIEAPWERLAA